MSQRQMARDMQTEMQARMDAKRARRDAQKAAKEDEALKKQIQALLKKGQPQQAYQKARMLLAKQAVATQMDQTADMYELSLSQIQANNSMNRMTAMMAQSNRNMARAQKNMNPERTLTTMEDYQQRMQEFGMKQGIQQDAMNATSSTQVPEDAVHDLLGKLADDAGVELSNELKSATPSHAEPARESATTEPNEEQEGKLQERLRALRA